MAFSTIFQRMKEKIIEIKPVEIYKIAHIYKCKKTNKTKIMFRISHERFVFSEYLMDVINDDKFIDCLDGKTVRFLTHLATLETLLPELFILSFQESSKDKSQKIVIKNKNNATTQTYTIEELISPEFIHKFNQVDAYKLGYLQAMKENNQEYILRADIKNEQI